MSYANKLKAIREQVKLITKEVKKIENKCK